jgi:hypothetical protein
MRARDGRRAGLEVVERQPRLPRGRLDEGLGRARGQHLLIGLRIRLGVRVRVRVGARVRARAGAGVRGYLRARARARDRARARARRRVRVSRRV